MENEKYFSVKELSEMLGISRQAIYKRLQTDLSTYVVEVDNQKYLKKAVLKEFHVNHSTQKVENQTEVESLKKIIEILEKELNEKQKIIDEWKDRYEKEHQQLLELTVKVGNALDSITQTQLANSLIEGRQLMEKNQEVQPEPQKKSCIPFFPKAKP